MSTAMAMILLRVRGSVRSVGDVLPVLLGPQTLRLFPADDGDRRCILLDELDRSEEGHVELPALDEVGAVVASVARLVAVRRGHRRDPSGVLATLHLHDAGHQ